MGLKGYRLWVMGQLDSTCSAPPRDWSADPPTCGVENEIAVDIWNSNTLTSNNRIGTCKVPLAGAFAKGYDDARWGAAR
jgi:hypothetical protein